jgi:hypothetical protein
MGRDSFTFLYVDYVRTSQETRLYASRTCYGGKLYFFVLMIIIPDRKHGSRPLRPIKGIVVIYFSGNYSRDTELTN